MNRNGMQGWIGRVKHAPVTHSELELTRESACQCLRLDLIEMLTLLKQGPDLVVICRWRTLV